MEAYKTPDSNLEIKGDIEFRPVKGLLIGMCVSVLLASLVSGVVGIVGAIAAGVDLTSPEAPQLMANYLPLVITDLILSILLLFYAGRTVGKRTSGKEIKFGLILSLLTCLIYLPLFILSDSFSLYPAWYNILVFAAVFLAIPFGAKSTIKT